MATFKFKQFAVRQDYAAMKVCTDSCIMGALTPKLEEGKILDIGTGTGLLAMMAAQINPQSMIDAVEIDKGAIEDASFNFMHHPSRENIQLHAKNILDYTPNCLYHLVLCNPPYFEKSLLPEDAGLLFAKHQHSLTLDQLSKQVIRLLHPEGRFMAMLPPYESSKLIKLNSDLGLYVQRIDKLHHYAHKTSFRWVITFSYSKSETIIRDLVIYKEPSIYTEEIIKLLSPFYLYL